MNTKKILRLFLVTLLINPQSAFAFGFQGDSGQSAPGLETDQFSNVESQSSGHVQGNEDRPMDSYKVDGKTPLVPGQSDYGDNVSGQDSPTQFNANAPFSGLEDEGYRTQSNKELIKRFENKAKFNLALDFYMNNFDYEDSKGIYDKTFDSNTGATGGSLNISSDIYFSKGKVNFGLGGGGGFGFSTGKGIFESNGQASEMNFNLYSIPADLRFVMEVPMGRVLKLSAAGGPSAMFLIQNRSDRDNEDNDKTKRQFGYGYFAEAKLKVNLSYLMPDTGFEYYRFHEVSFMSVDLMVRTQDYSGFADDISISGMSYGIGVTFEFL
jgi:hypothetical protein